MEVPSGTLAMQLAPHEMPPIVEVTVPPPAWRRCTVTVRLADASVDAAASIRGLESMVLGVTSPHDMATTETSNNPDLTFMDPPHSYARPCLVRYRCYRHGVHVDLDPTLRIADTP